jgi:hypothetical protein
MILALNPSSTEVADILLEDYRRSPAAGSQCRSISRRPARSSRASAL